MDKLALTDLKARLDAQTKDERGYAIFAPLDDTYGLGVEILKAAGFYQSYENDWSTMQGWFAPDGTPVGTTPLILDDVRCALQFQSLLLPAFGFTLRQPSLDRVCTATLHAPPENENAPITDHRSWSKPYDGGAPTGQIARALVSATLKALIEH